MAKRRVECCALMCIERRFSLFFFLIVSPSLVFCVVFVIILLSLFCFLLPVPFSVIYYDHVASTSHVQFELSFKRYFTFFFLLIWFFVGTA